MTRDKTTSKRKHSICGVSFLRLFLLALACVAAIIHIGIGISHVKSSVSSQDRISVDYGTSFLGQGSNETILPNESSSVQEILSPVDSFEILQTDQNSTIPSQETIPFHHQSHDTPQNRDYDVAAPKIVPGSGRCHYLPSIAHRQVPSKYANNFTYANESRTIVFEEGLLAEREDARPLYMYNPSLVPLTRVGQSLRDEITGNDWDLRNGGVQAMYLASYRVTTIGNCGPPGTGPPAHTENYLGLALLDEHLNIVNGTDIVIDLNRKLARTTNSFLVNGTTFHVPKQPYQDCRLFVMDASNATKNLNEDLYLTCNNALLPIFIHRVSKGLDLSEQAAQRRQAKALDNMVGDGLSLRVGRFFFISPTGKNFNVFQSTTKEYYVELWPLTPHDVFKITWPMSRDERITSDVPEPNATWLHPQNYTAAKGFTRDRGSGCCVEIAHNNQTYLMGVSHSRTIRGHFIHHQYMSRFYAFKTVPPFTIVAKTGLFCLGYGTPNESRGNVHVGVNEERKLQMRTGEKHFQCPPISFVSGISEHATNSSLVILSYGVADCYPRMIAIEKAELVSLLFLQGRNQVLSTHDRQT